MSWTLIEHQAPPRESLLAPYDFYPMADVDPWTGCWHWKGTVNNSGYGNISLRYENGERVTVQAHRIAAYIKYGEIPADMVVDHKCHVDAIETGSCAGGNSCMHRRCVNPDHLRFLSAEENRRYRTFPKHEKKKNTDTCQSGRHPWTDDNIEIRSDGARYCYPCFRENATAKQREKRAAQNPDKRSKEYWENSHCPNGHERTPENTANDSGKLRCRVCKNELARVWQAKKRMVK